MHYEENTRNSSIERRRIDYLLMVDKDLTFTYFSSECNFIVIM
jgi:hypothetical protein